MVIDTTKGECSHQSPHEHPVEGGKRSMGILFRKEEKRKHEKIRERERKKSNRWREEGDGRRKEV